MVPDALNQFECKLHSLAHQSSVEPVPHPSPDHEVEHPLTPFSRMVSISFWNEACITTDEVHIYVFLFPFGSFDSFLFSGRDSLPFKSLAFLLRYAPFWWQASCFLCDCCSSTMFLSIPKAVVGSIQICTSQRQ